MLMNIIVSGVFLKRRMFEHKRWSNTEYRQIIEQYLETYTPYPQQKKKTNITASYGSCLCPCVCITLPPGGQSGHRNRNSTTKRIAALNSNYTVRNICSNWMNTSELLCAWILFVLRLCWHRKPCGSEKTQLFKFSTETRHPTATLWHFSLIWNPHVP